LATLLERPHVSSFRDPSGFVCQRDGRIYRQVNCSYKDDYDRLLSSGLYKELVKNNLLIPHEEVGSTQNPPAYKIIKPEIIPFLSFPYEWCFSQLKDAALATLQIEKTALAFGMTLKDCSAYNIQFWHGRPLLIDTLSFEAYREGAPWAAYRQFCQHFLAPLALTSYRDNRLRKLLATNIDGLSLDLTSALLPVRSWVNFNLLVNIHMHALSQRYYAGRSPSKKGRMSKNSLLGLVNSLESAVGKLQWVSKDHTWLNYPEAKSYSPSAAAHKRRIVAGWLDKIRPLSLVDFGANTGLFSRIAAERGIFTLSIDADPACVEQSYLEAKGRGETKLLPLLMDLANPSPSIGWNNQERASFFDRCSADAVLSLALVHHLAIANNVPLPMIAELFFKICRTLIVEFIPKNDPMVERMLALRSDIFHQYHQSFFEEAFSKFFLIEEAVPVEDSQRTLYLMRKR